MARKEKPRAPARTDAPRCEPVEAPPPETKPAAAREGFHFVRREYDADGFLKG